MFPFVPRAIGLTLALSTLLASSATAKDWPKAGKWIIQEADADTCAMFLEYEGKGETDLVLSLSRNGTTALSLTNSNWTPVAEQVYELTYYLDGVGWSSVKSFGFESDNKKGFIAQFGPIFLKHFQASRYLRVENRDGTIIDNLDLAGSAVALAEVRQCVAHLRTVADAEKRKEAVEAREKARFVDIPDDPFAKPNDGSSPVPSAPRYGGNLSNLITPDDYPASAIENNEQGQVRFRLTVDADGHVSNCEVLQSSGSNALDENTCRIMRARAHFTPARSESGDAIVGSVEDVAHWSLR